MCPGEASSPSFSTTDFLEGLPDGFQSFDNEWRYTHLNRRAEKLLGRSRESLLGKVCWEEFPSSAGTPFHQKCLEASSTGQTLVLEEYFKPEDVWSEHTLHPYSGGLGVFTRNITDRKKSEEAVRRNEQQFHALFDQVQNAVLLADDNGNYTEANAAACELLGISCEELLGKSIFDFAPPRARAQAEKAWKQFLQTGEQAGEFLLQRPDGSIRTLEFRARANVRPGIHLSVLHDISERKTAEKHAERLLAQLAEERDTLDTVNRVGRILSAELDLHKLVQAATDAATDLTRAQFGAFFYNTVSEQNEALLLYTISGAPIEAFSRFPHPRATPLFGPTFRGEGIIRIGDVAKDARFGQMAPHHGMPPEHLPVRSYLAVPVTSRSGEVLGGLFFGHAEPDIFTEQAERNLVALVAQIAIAVDNARLFSQVQREAATQARQARYALLRADVSAALADGGDLQEMLQRCAEPLVNHLDATFARIWTLDAQDNVLVLQASAGRYTHLNGPHSRVPVGEKKIGLIAQEKKPYLSQDVLADERIVEKEWAQREGIVAFAGYPLLLDGRVIGVVALFARHVLAPDTLDTLAFVADALALGVERKQMEQRLTESQEQQRSFLRDVLASVTGGRLRLCTTAEELPAPLPVCGETVLLESRNLREARYFTQQAAQAVGLNNDRSSDLLTAVGEATMNAVRHGGGGLARACTEVSAGVVQVWVTDHGSGIAVDRLPQATLERGYSGSDGFGHGFWLMLQTVDKVWLLTNPGGTTVVIEQGREEKKPGWLKDR